MNKKILLLAVFVALVGSGMKAQTMEYTKYVTPDYKITNAASCKPYNHNIQLQNLLKIHLQIMLFCFF